MSLIRFYANGRLATATLMQLRSATGRSAAELANAEIGGGPIAEFVLFKKDHDQIAEKIKSLLANIAESELSVVECVIDLKTGMERCHQTSFDIIKNILDEAEQISRDLDGRSED
ncbi:hypothetical protein [Paracidovorax avenae]|uniref:hypothetical protein n=1 Tax=Paracidovorax avenae TaxID=80867 RepID=UPI001313E232|nr:hypothetical protein [Paracidovorax avenae]